MNQKVRDLASAILRHPGFAYTTIFLLQLKMLWKVWHFRDLTSGDTSYYYLNAYDWFRNGHLFITWSPLYTSFYGAMLHLSEDAYVATIASRVIPVLALSILVLALMRRLLPPAIAWLMAAWWVMLPIDFDSLYEVHIFAVIPVVIVFLAILCLPGTTGRAWGLAALLTTTFLMRNELMLATILFGAAAITWEVRQRSPRWKLSYASGVAAACALILFFYSHSNDPPISKMLDQKHTLNICQTYAFGYRQRNSDWTGSPWTECQQLMTRVYGDPEPPLLRALLQNPSAMLGHFLWNIRLLPDGLSLLLFNCTFGNITPDYIPGPVRPLFAALASIGVLSIVLAGSIVLWRGRRQQWKQYFTDRAWAWVAMICVTVVVAAVVVTERPRPSYMLAFGLILRAFVGTCLWALVIKLPKLRILMPAAAAAVFLAALLGPNYYAFRYGMMTRPLVDAYRRLAPFEERLSRTGTALVAIGWAPDLCNYLTATRSCQPLDFREVRREVTPQEPWDEVLSRHQVELFYADSDVMLDAQGRDFVTNAAAYGWRILSLQDEAAKSWAVLGRTNPDKQAPQPVLQMRDVFDAGGGIKLGTGWYGLESFKEVQFRWVNNDAEFTVQPQKDGPATLLLDVDGGPSLKGAPLTLQILSDGKLLDTITTRSRQTVKIDLPHRALVDGAAVIRLHVDSANAPIPNDPRIMNFRVFRISIP